MERTFPEHGPLLVTRPDEQGRDGPAPSEQTHDEAFEAVVASTDPTQLGSRWILDFLPAPDGPPVQAAPQVASELTFGDGEVFGRGGVNRFRGSYVASDDGTLTFGGIAATRMAGPEPAMGQESRFFAALSTTVAFEIAGDRLVLRGSDGQTVAVLVRAVA